MPQLSTATTDIKQFFLPSTSNLPQEDQAWVRMNVGEMLGGDIMDLIGENEVKPGAISCVILASRIKEWNFTKPDGIPEEIAVESVRRMEMADLAYLLQQFTDKLPAANLGDDQKKS
jgi:hypothetical protein